MTPLKIVIDARRLRDFGIGTYIRSLVHALGVLDTTNEYALVTLPDDSRTLSGLPRNFETAVYQRADSDYHDHVSFPMFLRTLSADLFHIPLNRVPLLMPKPYVVTIHDMASLLFDQRSGPRMDWRRFLFRRGLERAERIIAVSASTRRDVQNILGIPANRVRVVYNAPAPEFFTHQRTADARAAGPEAESLERKRILERYQINYP
ncbi:MAG: glycosyltransferase, partial [Acidobacteria bacterium]|nr:glycosyltransferase [Acidobacteriota bacterium]